AERRFLTVAFIDMVGSTEISSQLDPEDYRDALEFYQGEVRAVAGAYDGHVAKLLGDGAIVYFGYPIAHEDAPRRACLAGLEIVRRIDDGAAELERRFGTAVRCRVGIHSGLTVIGSMGAGPARATGDVVGDLPNIAARLEGLAGPGDVLVSDTTHSLVKGYFDSVPLGPQSIRGLADMMAVHLIVAPTSARARLDVNPATGRTGFVGRSDELMLLGDAWHRARAGASARISVSGEAGIGKSRLLEHFREQVVGEGGVWLEGGCSEYRSGSAFHAFTDALARVLRQAGIADSDRDAMARHLGVGADHAGFLASLLTGAEPVTADTLTPVQIRRGTVAAIRAWIAAAASKSPVALVVEDLHWADPSSLSVIEELTHSPDPGPVLVLTTWRPGFQPADSATGPLLSLGRLSHEDTVAMVEAMTAGGLLDDEARQVAVTRTDGVPLFIEEMVIDLRSSSSVPVGGQIPTSLHDLLTARLDKLGAAKRTAQVAAVLGRTFSRRAVAALAPDLVGRLDDDLALLTASDLAFSSRALGVDSITFKHSLIRDAAYESLLRRQRKDLHAGAAEALQSEFPELVIQSPEIIAHHLSAAGRVRPALEAWVDAGRVAVGRSDHEEAIGHYRTALGLLEGLEESELDDSTELRVQVQLGSPLTAARGYASPEVEAAYVRAAELAKDGGDSRQMFLTARGLAQVYLLRADIGRSRELLDDALERATASDDREQLLEAIAWLGTVQFFQGDFAVADRNLVRAAEIYDPIEDRRHRLDFGVDPGILAMSHRVWLLWLTGAPRASRLLGDEMVGRARSLQHPLSLAHALNYLAGLHHLRGEEADLGRVAVEEVALATEFGFPHYTSYGGIFCGRSRAVRDAPSALAEMATALAVRRGTGAALALPYHLAMIAEAHLHDDDPVAALAKTFEAGEVAVATGERWWSPEILRIRGAAHAAAGDEAAALRDTTAAIAAAVDAGSMSLELRAELQRHGLTGGRRDRIRELLDHMLDDDETADLRLAREITDDRPKGTP
ncbi:MAG: AAA family ATPase, partial [Actinomycetota bacterium]|nr:AAA family ATPase [Actinomycetota bacterium]